MVDPRLSRERANLLTRTINALRHIAEIELLPGDALEEEILQKIQATPYHLVLVPWYRYFNWSRVEAHFGLTRTRGPTFAGYHCDHLTSLDIGSQAEHLRTILLDFGGMTSNEAVLICRSLLHEARRSGIQPLLKPSTPIYCENWYASQGLGNRLDSILGLPEITTAGWAERSATIRMILVALWGLIYEDGPGKSELGQGTSQTPRAAFQFAADEQSMVFRLNYAMPSWTPKTAVTSLWPTSGHPSSNFQFLLRYADFIRLHTLSENPMIELVVGLLPSAASKRNYGTIHTVWVEQIAPQLVTEPPFDLPGPNAPRLRLLPTAPVFAQKPRPAESDEGRAKDRFLNRAITDIRLLRGVLAEREELIKDLRSGGVSTAPPIPPPDAEALLEAFQERYFEARYQIRQFEIQIAELEKRNAGPEEIETLRKKMEALSSRENAWIRKLLKTIQVYRDTKQRPPT
ncbi:MAG: hypothetical protein A2X94_08600 [Bdellovibrionales bacterium GWB1_55_8]|nr:MAG: hypothetical protein A2X94_08600 [Bdellovibrionales bacterium GWB1_55_8]